MLLLGALFALFLAGFWLYCLFDVALTPGSECRGLPKAAWIVVVAGTFVIGAAAWLAVRHPAGVTLAPAPPAGFKPRGSQAGGWDRPEADGNLEAEAAFLRHPAGRSRPRQASSRPTRPTRPQGPDDDPEFLRTVDRAIHGDEP
jgi:hypothetical protein